MSGGIAIALMIIALVVLGIFALVTYLTGGAISFSRDRGGDDDDAARKEGRRERPAHTTPTSPTQEHTNLVGTHRRGDGARDGS